MNRTTVTWLMTLLISGSGWAAEGFSKLNYKQALEQAASQKKWVFIDFYTTWCGPCKMMDDTTFKDPDVVKWMSQKAIALKIDAEAQEEIALKHRVDGYPTLVFLKPDGSEFERLSGYIPAGDLKRTFRQVETGKTALVVAKEKVDASPNDPVLRLDYGTELSQRSRWEEAWREYRWCLDQGVKKDPKFARLGVDALLGSMIGIGGPYEKARLELMALRNQAEERIRSGEASVADCQLVRDVNNVTSDDARTLELYDAMVKRGDKKTLTTLTRALMPLLVQAQRYTQINDYVDVVQDAKRVLAQAAEAADYLGRHLDAADREPLRDMLKENAALRVSDHYQVLLALDKTEQADALAKSAMSVSDSATVYGAFSWSGYLSGKPVEANVAWARKALELVGGQSADIVDTLARLLHKLGRKEEAVKVCRAALDKSDDLRSRLILQDCLEDISGKGDDATGS